MNREDKCPECGNRLERDEVDVGMGAVVYGPYGCPECGWQEEVIDFTRNEEDKL